MTLGGVGNTSTLIWLFCDLQNFGKTLVRKGNKPGLPINKPPIWVFCPLLKGNFPRDRQLVEECEKCSHYKGVSHNVREAYQKGRPRQVQPAAKIDMERMREIREIRKLKEQFLRAELLRAHGVGEEPAEKDKVRRE